MEAFFEKYRKLCIDGSLICLAYNDTTEPYFCYPVQAKTIGFEGSILYCFIPEYGEMVFASNPESCADRYVYPLAKNFHDFMRLIIACGSANPVEQIVWMSKKQFEQHLREELASQTEAQKTVLMRLQNELRLSSMEEPFEYVKQLQKDFDDSRIKYHNEYYDTLGIERPDGTGSPVKTDFDQAVFSFFKKTK